MTPDNLLRNMFDAAIASAQPTYCVPPYLPTVKALTETFGKGRMIVIGAGKASAAMAQAVEQHWHGPLSGLVVTRYGHEAPCQSIEIVQAAHPVPDQAGWQAAQRILDMMQGLAAEDVVLCLISGGGSALLPLPLNGLTLADKQTIHQSLLASGANIHEMNTVRKHLSVIKGGRLAAASYPAQLVTLLISDVPGDHPTDIASGPTVADPTTCADALAIIDHYKITIPNHVREILLNGQNESIKPNDARLAHCQTHIIATPNMALQAAAQVAEQAGWRCYILSDDLEGEARVVGTNLAELARQVANRTGLFTPPCILLSGGETTVTMHNNAANQQEHPTSDLSTLSDASLLSDCQGGRNVECLLAFALACANQPNIYALMGDTDGVDGVANIAGAWIEPNTLARAVQSGLNPQQALQQHDAHRFFSALNQSIITGPTRTNVNDFRAILIQ